MKPTALDSNNAVENWRWGPYKIDLKCPRLPETGRSELVNECQAIVRWCGKHLALQWYNAAVHIYYCRETLHPIVASRGGKRYPCRR